MTHRGSARVPRRRASSSDPADAPAASAFGLVEAKLAPPQLRSRMLPRDALVGRLLQARDEPLVALIAPAGYGKSTVLALWRAREPRPVAWLTADDADADPARFLAHLSVAMARASGLDLSQLDQAIASGAPALSSVVPSLSSALLRDGRPLVVMIDDIHRLTGRDTVDALAMLVDYLPHNVVVAVAGRGDAGLPMARLRVAGKLVEVTTADLAFDRGESARLADLWGRPLGDDQAASLNAVTEGWPAAVYLAVRRASIGGVDGDRDLGPAGRDVDIAEYLDAELLRGIAPGLRTFMLRTSILERMTADLCDDVAGRRNSARLLQKLVEQTQLVAPLDMEGSWFRYHPLVRDHLQRLLAQEPGGAAPYHRRAAAWFGRHGVEDAAVDHLFAAGDAGAAAAAASGIAVHLFRIGREATIARWIAHLVDGDLRDHPYLAAFAALVAALAGRTADAERLMELADAGEYPRVRPPGAESFEAARAVVRALMARQGLGPALAEGEAALASVPPSSEWRVIAQVNAGILRVLAGDPDGGEALLRTARETAPRAAANRTAVLASAWLALGAIGREDWAAADRLVHDGSEWAARLGQGPDVASAWLAVATAQVAVRHGRVDEARRAKAAFSVSRPSLGPATSWLSVRCLLEAAKVELALADPAGARSCLTQASDILARRPDLGDLPDQVGAMRERIRSLPPGPGGASTLTPAEIRVLRLLPTYLTAPEMAQRLFVSTNTVRTQIQSVYGKLGAMSRAEAVDLAIEAGLLEPLPVLAEGRITSS